MAEKTLNTRILLKYDSYANWTTNNPTLKAGEVAFATISAAEVEAGATTQEVGSVAAPQVLIKVGDGVNAYNALPFASAKAADVYSYAKKPEAEFKAWVKGFIDVTDIDLSAYSTIEYVDGKISDLQESIAETYATKEELAAVLGTDADDATANTVYGAKAAAAAAQTAADTAQDEVDALEGVVDGINTRLGTAEGAITTLNGDASTEGSVDKKVADAIAGLNIDQYATDTDLSNLETTLSSDIDAVDSKIDILIGDDTAKSVRTIANEELAKQLIPEGASESLDSLQEIAAWIQDHPDDASAMNAAITALQAQLKGIDAGEGTVKKYIDDAITALNVGQYALAADLTALAGRVATLETSSHAHGNKEVLDGITAEKVSAWDAAEQNAKDYADGLAGNYDAAGSAEAVQDDLDAYKETNDAAVGELGNRLDTIEGDYLKAADTYIFDCGNSVIS